MDGAKYKGYMTAEFVSFMEQYAYTVALRDYCIAPRESRRIAMPELFELIAGSETGAIIATMINLPNDNTTSAQKNKYFANNATDWFDKYEVKLYHNPKLPVWMNITINLVVLLIFGPINYMIASKIFTVSNFDENVKKLRFLIRYGKKKLKVHGNHPEITIREEGKEVNLNQS